MELTINDLAKLLDGKVEGESTQLIKYVGSLKKGKSGSVSFLSNPKYEADLYETEATAVLISNSFVPTSKPKSALIRVADPYLSFAIVLEAYQKSISLIKTGIDPQTHVGKDTTHGDEFYLGPFASLGENVVVGNHVKIYPNVSIGDNCIIGNNTVIHAGAKIYSNTQIGNYCVVHAGAVIGSDGFGFAPDASGNYLAIPHVGNVILEDHVSIGANTVIDCATFDSTIIRKGVKLDNLIQVAHNVEIGNNTVIAAQTGSFGFNSHR